MQNPNVSHLNKSLKLMKFRPSNFIQWSLATILIFLSFSCNKDSDLLAEYVIENPQAFMVKDAVVTLINNPVVIKPLSNDTFKEPEKVTITEVTLPKMGTAEVQEDNTVLYTPNTNETGTDEFDYTTTITNKDNTVSTETGSITVTVTPTDKTYPITGDNVYYVTTTGKSSNKGDTEAAAWSIQHAFNTAKAGDVIYIKAGNYGAQKLSTVRNGTIENPITFIGYKASPGDINVTNGSTYSKTQWQQNGNTLPANQMPLLDNAPINNNPPVTDKAFNISHSYISIENIMIQDYYDGVLINGGTNVKLKNVIAARLGNWNPNSNCWGQPDLGGCDNRVGYGFHLQKAHNYLIENCLIIDAGHVGIDIIGTNNGVMTDSEVWSASSGNATDYNIILWGSSYNTFNKIRSYRYKGPNNSAHQGRALAVKCRSNFNVINGLDAENLRLQVYFESNDNTFNDINLIGNNDSNDSGVQIFGNANRNTFRNVKMTNGSGIMFLGDNAECISNGDDPSGSDNYFINPTITNVVSGLGQAAISYHRLLSNGTSGGTNYIVGGSIDGAPHLFNTNRPGTIHISNTSISNINQGYKTFYPNSSAGWREYTIQEKFENVNFNKCNFTIPIGINITTSNR